MQWVSIIFVVRINGVGWDWWHFLLALKPSARGREAEAGKLLSVPG